MSADKVKYGVKNLFKKADGKRGKGGNLKK